MLSWAVAAVAALVVSLALYGWREPRRLGRVGPLVLLRAVALTVLIALLLDAAAGRRRPPPAVVAVDVSASWLRGGDTALWRTARDRARRLAADTVWMIGDSLRAGAPPEVPSDNATRAAPLAERALASGRPVVLITDGELDDPAALRALPAGSRVEIVPRPARSDLAVVALDAPRAAVAGDTIEVAVTVRAGSAPTQPTTVTLALAGRDAPPRTLGSMAVDALAPGTERRLFVRVPLAAPDGPAALAAIVAAPGDVERRNDSLAVAVDVARAAGAVLVSSSPDQDARFLVPVLRGAVSLPTRAYYRVAPGQWRVEGALAPVSEAEVRRALREAPLAILHGDTTIFGAPRGITAGALALFPAAAAADGGEWYPVAAPPSPISAALGGIPWDSLTPLAVSPEPPRGEWEGLVAAPGRDAVRRVVIVGGERPRRIVVIGATGFWRWQFRGGTSADAYSALWGSIFDWLSAERTDQRAAVPADAVVRAGDRIRWRRGAGGAPRSGDSLVVAALTRRGAPSRSRVAARVDSVALRFGAGGTVAESDPLPAGVYDVAVPGGPALLVVNASRELLPQAATVRSGGTGGTAAAGDRPRLRDRGWPYLVVLAALCAEWLLRRRLGLR